MLKCILPEVEGDDERVRSDVIAVIEFVFIELVKFPVAPTIEVVESIELALRVPENIPVTPDIDVDDVRAFTVAVPVILAEGLVSPPFDIVNPLLSIETLCNPAVLPSVPGELAA